ncbi:hypothetical protein CBL_14022 [Carabus blaptoides fortunei]
MASEGKPEVPLLCESSSGRRAGRQAGEQPKGNTDATFAVSFRTQQQRGYGTTPTSHDTVQRGEHFRLFLASIALSALTLLRPVTTRYLRRYYKVELGSAANIGQGLLSQAVNNLQHKLPSSHNDRVHCSHFATGSLSHALMSLGFKTAWPLCIPVTATLSVSVVEHRVATVLRCSLTRYTPCSRVPDTTARYEKKPTDVRTPAPQSGTDAATPLLTFI